MSHPAMNEAKRPPLWERILGLVKEGLAERHSRKLLVKVVDECGVYEKEIGELALRSGVTEPRSRAW